jgi:hypothetical protein
VREGNEGGQPEVGAWTLPDHMLLLFRFSPPHAGADPGAQTAVYWLHWVMYASPDCRRRALGAFRDWEWRNFAVPGSGDRWQNVFFLAK